MVVNLEKEDLVNMLMGVTPDYSQFKYLHNLGTYNGSYDTWTWSKYNIMNLPEEEIFETYTLLKFGK